MHQAAFVLPQYVKVELDDGESVLDEIYNDEDDDDEEGDRCVLSGCIISWLSYEKLMIYSQKNDLLG